MLPLKLSLVVVIVSYVQSVSSSGVCEELVVVLPDINVLLKYFDHFSAIGHYKRVGGERTWTQLHGRHQVVIENSTSSDGELLHQLSFLASSASSASPEYIGLNATFKEGLDFSNDDVLISKLHTQLFSWDVYNHTFLYSQTSYTSQFDELFIYCFDDGEASTSTVCTGDRVLDVTLNYNYPNGSSETINDPEVNVFRHHGTYRENRPVYVQDDGLFEISYIDLLYFFIHYYSWTVMLKSSSHSTPLSSIIYISTITDDASPLPELSTGVWRRYGASGNSVSSPIKCAARLKFCTSCNYNNTDACVKSPTDTLYYCVCKIGYEGETCDNVSATCSRPPIDIVGLVPEYYKGGPFYSGEIITVSCFTGYPSLLSRWKYITTCTNEGRWTVEGACLDFSLVDASVDRTNLTQLVSSLIEGVESRIVVVAKTATTVSPFAEFIKQDWFITVVLAVWACLPLLSMLIGWLVLKYRVSKGSTKTSVWRMVSVHTYVWIWICILWELFSLTIGFTSDVCCDVFFYLNIFTAIILLVLYIVHLLAMLFSSEMSVISKNYPVLVDGYFDLMGRDDKPELSVTVECYHDQTITKKVKQTNSDKVICEQEVTEQEPVVTKVFNQIFNYETCQDKTPHLELTPSTIVEIGLKLQVKFADDETENGFYAMKSDLESAHKDEDDKANTFQVVRLTTTEHQLRKDLDVTVHSMVGPRRFYHNIWFFRAMLVVLMGVPVRYYLATRVIKPPQIHTICKEIRGVARDPRPVRVSMLG